MKTKFPHVCRMRKKLDQMLSRYSDEFVKNILKYKDVEGGFTTDESLREAPYTAEELRLPLFEAIELSGAKPDGGEFCILNGRVFLSSAYFLRKIKKIPGVARLRLTCRPPRKSLNFARVAVKAEWKINGVCFEARFYGRSAIIVRANKGCSDAMLKKKASRRVLQYILATLENQSVVDAQVFRRLENL